MRRIKIAWLHSHFNLWMGGTKFIYEVTSRLAIRDDLDVFVETADSDIAAGFRDAGVSVTELGGRSSDSVFYWLLFPYFLWKELRALRRQTVEYDVIVANVFPMNWLASRLSKPYVFFCFDPYLFFYDKHMINGLPFPKRMFTKVLGLLYRGFDKAGTRRADAVLTLNNATAGWIKDVYGRESITTFAGVDTELFYKRGAPRPGDPYGDKKFIIHSTDYSPVKGTPSVIEAFAKVKKTVPDLYLVITHTRENKVERDGLIELANRLGVSRAVEFLGFVDIERLAELYSAASVLVAPGRGMSLPVQEAMASETPVVRNRHNTDEVVHGESGFLVDTDDIDGFADAIKKILNDPDLAERMGKAGRQTVMDKFNWDKVCGIVRETLAASVDSGPG